MAKTVRTRIIDEIKDRIKGVDGMAAVGEPGLNWPDITQAMKDGEYVSALSVTDDESLGEADAHIGNAFSFLIIVEIVLPDRTAEVPPIPWYENGADIYRRVRQAVMGDEALRSVNGLVTRIDCIGGGGVGFQADPQLGEITTTAVGFAVHYRHDWDDPEVVR